MVPLDEVSVGRKNVDTLEDLIKKNGKLKTKSLKKMQTKFLVLFIYSVFTACRRNPL